MSQTNEIMTTEEKAKAYDRALNWIRELYPGLHGATKEDAERYFPELRKEEKTLTPFQQCLNCILRGVYYAEVPDEKVNEFIVNIVRTRTDELIKLAKTHEYTDCQLRESEDERIRKGLIEIVSDIAGGWPFEEHRITKKEAITYLEKQKDHFRDDTKKVEQKPAEKEITLNGFEKVLDSFLFDFVHSPIIDCEPKEYIKNHSVYLLKAAYKELNAQLKQDFFEAQQEGRREGYEAAMAEQKPKRERKKNQKNLDSKRQSMNLPTKKNC